MCVYPYIIYLFLNANPNSNARIQDEVIQDEVGEKVDQLENNIPTEAAAESEAEPPPISTEVSDSSDHQGTSKADNMDQDDCLDEEVVA